MEKDGRIYPGSCLSLVKDSLYGGNSPTFQGHAQVGAKECPAASTPPSHQGWPWWRGAETGRRKALPGCPCLKLVRGNAELVAIVVAEARTDEAESIWRDSERSQVQKVRNDKWHVLGPHNTQALHREYLMQPSHQPQALLRLREVDKLVHKLQDKKYRGQVWIQIWF